MLVLSRGTGERLVIDDGRIRVTVVSTRGGIVRLGVEAPRDVRIDREEIHKLRRARSLRPAS